MRSSCHVQTNMSKTRVVFKASKSTSKEVIKDSKSKGRCTKGDLTFYIMYLTIDVQFIVLALMTCIVGSNNYELHPMDEYVYIYIYIC